MSDFSKRNDEINARLWEALVEQALAHMTFLNGVMWAGMVFGYTLELVAGHYG